MQFMTDHLPADTSDSVSNDDFDEDREERSTTGQITASDLFRAQAEPIVDEPLLEGEDFGKYMLVGELATGGMAELFLAVHKGPEGFLKVVVVKRVLPHLAASPEFVHMFADEARIAARLEHPNIVRTYEFGASEGNYFTVMEYLAGEDLSSILRRVEVTNTPIPVGAAALIMRDVCKGLHFAHELTDTAGRPLGLVHRDVNPTNIVVTYSGETKVIDFGVAKATTNMSKTVVGTVKGKTPYMAPEQILGRDVDRRADVFSTGIVLWELLTSRSLFTRDNEAATMYAIMNDPIPPPSRYRSDVLPALDEIVARALSRTPADRFETMEDLQGALEDFVATTLPAWDARRLATMLEQQFGRARADAKHAIARTQNLGRNISLVMKLRTDVQAELAQKLRSALAEAAKSGEVPLPPVELAPQLPPPSRTWVVALGAAALLAIGGVLVFIATRDSQRESAAVPAPQRNTATVKLESKPAGAVVFINGEPTGFVTPATLSDVPAGSVVIRLELDGYAARDTTLKTKPGDVLAHAVDLVPSQGRLVIGGLAAGASVIVDGVEYPAGEVIPTSGGQREVVIILDGKTLVRQSIDIGAGEQVWELQGGSLVKK